MTKILSFVLLCFVLVFPASAQVDCKMCGDWVGVKQAPESIEGDFTVHSTKTYVRIKKSGDNYIVRVKSHSVDDPSDIHYWNDCIITSSSENSIGFTSFLDEEIDQSNTYRHGMKVYKISWRLSCSLTFLNGVMKMHRNIDIRYWDKGNKPLDSESYPDGEITLYKEDDDW